MSRELTRHCGRSMEDITLTRSPLFSTDRARSCMGVSLGSGESARCIQWSSQAGPVDDHFEIADCSRLCSLDGLFRTASQSNSSGSGPYSVEEIAGELGFEFPSTTQSKHDRVSSTRQDRPNELIVEQDGAIRKAKCQIGGCCATPDSRFLTHWLCQARFLEENGHA